MQPALMFGLMSVAVMATAASAPSAGDAPPAGPAPAWKSKPIPQWDQQDGRQVLSESPWVAMVKLQKVPDLAVAARQMGGDWEAGIGPRVSFEALDIFEPARAAEAIRRAHQPPDLGLVAVRWESAAPVRAAEVKAGEMGIPTWQGDYYAIAVYGIPPPFRWNMENEVKGVSYLRRDKKKDLKPARVEIQRQESGLANIVFLFSRHNEITRQDRYVQFVAQIGRYFVAQAFPSDQMQFDGKPEF